MYQALIRKLVLNVVLFSALCLSGCATVQYHDWHEGEPKSGAILTSAETVIIESINGRQTNTSFIGQTHTYELSPGTYTVVLTYADLFDKSADDFEKVKSNPVKLVFPVEKGVSYRLEHRKINGLADAADFAKKPVIQLLDTKTGNELDARVEYTTTKSFLSRFKFASDQEQVFASEYIGQPASNNDTQTVKVSEDDSSALKMLKFSWQQATPVDRQAFLKWLNNQ